jgi:cyclopropane fatty-acyl-phospholipid synthase-like methyltransferase
MNEPLENRIFENYLTNHYSNLEKTDFSSDADVLNLLKNNSAVLNHNFGDLFSNNVGKTSAILDLGCGYGSFLSFLQSKKYINVTGVDLSTQEISICKKLFKLYIFVQEDVLNFVSRTDKKFDVVYLSHVIEHIKKENLFEFLDGVKRILNDGGFFLIVAPNSAAYFNAAANRYGDLTHEIGYTELSLRQVLMVSGFKDIKVKNFYGAGKPFLRFLRKTMLFMFEIFVQVLGYDKQKVHTPSILVIAKK